MDITRNRLRGVAWKMAQGDEGFFLRVAVLEQITLHLGVVDESFLQPDQFHPVRRHQPENQRRFAKRQPQPRRLRPPRRRPHPLITSPPSPSPAGPGRHPRSDLPNPPFFVNIHADSLPINRRIDAWPRTTIFRTPVPKRRSSPAASIPRRPTCRRKRLRPSLISFPRPSRPRPDA